MLLSHQTVADVRGSFRFRCGFKMLQHLARFGPATNLCFSTCRLPWFCCFFFFFFLLLFVLFFLLEHIGLCTARTAAKHSLVYALLKHCSDSHFQHRGGRRPPGCKAGDGSSRLPVAFSCSGDEAKPKGFFLQPGLKSCRLCVPFAPLRGRPLRCLLWLHSAGTQTLLWE